MEEVIIFLTLLEDVVLEEVAQDSWEDGLELVELEESVSLEELCWVSMEDKCNDSLLDDYK